MSDPWNLLLLPMLLLAIYLMYLALKPTKRRPDLNPHSETLYGDKWKPGTIRRIPADEPYEGGTTSPENPYQGWSNQRKWEMMRMNPFWVWQVDNPAAPPEAKQDELASYPPHGFYTNLPAMFGSEMPTGRTAAGADWEIKPAAVSDTKQATKPKRDKRGRYCK